MELRINSTNLKMDMILMVCSVATLFVTVQSSVAMDAGSVQESEMVLDQSLFVQLVRRVENLEKRDQDQQTEIDSLRGELNTEKVKTARLERRVFRHHASLGAWLRTDKKVADTAAKTNDDAAIATDDVAIATGDVPKVTDNVEAAQQESHRVGGREADAIVASDDGVRSHASKIRRQAESPVIAFHATLSKTSAHSGVHQIVAFDRVITNIGNAYNSHFGSFVAPMSGVYVFHTRVQMWSHSSTEVSLLKNGSSVAQMYINGNDDAGAGSSTMAVLHMIKGDDVAVQNNYANADIEGSHYSHFSGFLLHMDDEGASIVG